MPQLGLFEIVIFMIVILGVPLVFAGFCAWLAKTKGRNSVMWGFLGFFFNVLALIALAVAGKKE